GGLRFHYVTWGPDSAPPVLLLHGITGHARTWDALARDLSADFRVIALDQRGHGDSDRAPDADYRVATMAGDVERFVEALGLERRANPRMAEAGLRDRVRHGLRPLADGGFEWKYDKALREMMRQGGRRDTIDLWEPLRRIAVPALLVRGAESDVLSADVAKRM